MAISTYDELKTAITDWMARTDISGSAADFITLAEARLNRMLNAVSTTATLTCTAGSSTLSISSLSVVEPVALFLTDDLIEYEVPPAANGTFTILTESGFPQAWAIEGTNIKFDRPCETAYSARFVYQGRFALSDAAPTNDFLTNHPDLYLAAALVWGNSYVKDVPALSAWAQLLSGFEAEVRNNEAQKKRSRLKVDTGLRPRGELAWLRGTGS